MTQADQRQAGMKQTGSRFGINARLGIVFAVLLAVFSGYGLLAMTDMSRLNASATDIRLNRLPTLQAADALGTAVAQFRVGEARAILEDDPAMLAGGDTALQQQETRLGSRQEERRDGKEGVSK